MKKTNLFFAILGVMLLASCKSEIDCPENPLSTVNHVRFNSTIGEMTKTRASGTTWDTGDAIGIYALNEGQTLSDQAIYDGKSNVKHTTTGDGVFAAATEAITFPESGNLDFVAYYPYQTTITGYAYPVNVSNQSVPAAIDILYSNNAKGANKSNTPVSLVFKHMLSQLVLSVSAGEGVISLDGLTAKVEGLKIDGSMNLVNGVVTIGSTVGALTPAAAVSGTNATVSAIIIPGQDLNSAKVSFTLNGKVYEWTPTAQALESGKKYTYLLKLSTTGLVTVQPKATITDWADGYTGTSDIILTPNEDPQFITDKTTVSLPATGTLTDVVKLTTETGQAWSAASNQSWLTVSDASGTGSKDITLTAEENTTTSGRIATVTITADGSASFDPIVITVTQAAGSTMTALLFPGSDFENWSAFLGVLNTYGLSADGYASENTTGGRNASKALHLKGTPTKNDYTFTAIVKDGYSLAGKSKIVFYIKGTSGKTLSLNVYTGAGTKMGTDYKCFNLGNYTSEQTIAPTDANSYTGVIDTNGEWMKVTLDISSLTVNSTAGQNLFALKVGSNAAYDLLVDDIRLE